MQDRTYPIIRFTASGKEYHGDSVHMPDVLRQSGKYVPLREMAIPLGTSRYGGPVVDLPPGASYPEGMLFAAQIDLAQAAPKGKQGWKNDVHLHFERQGPHHVDQRRRVRTKILQ